MRSVSLIVDDGAILEALMDFGCKMAAGDRKRRDLYATLLLAILFRRGFYLPFSTHSHSYQLEKVPKLREYDH